MMTAGQELFSSQDLPRLAALVGPTTLARGRVYAERGAVLARVGDGAAGQVTGLVQGSASVPYRVVVRVVRDGAGRLSKIEADCTCPVGWNCKHAVAVLLAAAPAATLVPGKGGPPPWSGLLGLLDEAPEETAGRHYPGDLGLMFELVEPKTVPARGRPSSVPPGPRIKLRPVVYSPRCNWVRTGVSWRGLDYHGYGRRDGRSGVHIDLMKELRMLAGLGNPSWARYGDEAVWLDSIGSRRLWDLLQEMTDAGVALVGSGKGADPVLLEPAPLELHLDVSGGVGGLRVTATFAPGGAGEAGLGEEAGRLWIGRPAHGVARWFGRRQSASTPEIRLGPLARTLPEAVRNALGSGPMTIGPADRAEFEASVLPRLRRRVRVGSRDGSVTFSEMVPDRVVATVGCRDGPVVNVAWSIETGLGGPGRPVGDSPDPAAREVLAQAAEVMSPYRDLAGGGWSVPLDVSFIGLEAARFVTELLPRLEDLDGLDVRVGGDLPEFRETTSPPQVRFVGAGDAQEDWLDLAVEVEVDGEEVPFALLFTALAEGASHLLLPSGTYFALDRPELARLAGLIAEARSIHDAPPGRVRLTRYQSSLVDELAEVGTVQAAGLERLQDLADDPLDRPVPAGLAATLRPYQHDGFQWLAARYERGLGGVLADDMGLGKTVQALALVCHAREALGVGQPFLVVAPTSVVGNWAKEAERFAPGLGVVAVSETSARAGAGLAEQIGGAGLVVTSYTLFRIDRAAYEAVAWAGLLLDEAQFAKNAASHANQAARRLRAPWKLALTGTPLENSLSELWALLAITSPGLLGRPDHFDEAYRRPIERHGDQARLGVLRRRIRPWMLRRTKEEVAPELPAKQDTVLELELDGRHRQLYDTYLQRERQKVLGLIEDMRGNRFEILRSLTLLRQAALDLSLVDPRHGAIPSAKLDELVAMVSELVADGHRALVFSQFTRFLDRARRAVEDSGIECCYLDGATRRRAAVIERFRSGEAPVFMISLKAGGFGLNLTEADYCILLDPWWNPATEAQAVDRAHRIGQTRPVMVYRLVSKGTIEEKVMALKDRKSKLFESVVGGGGFESATLSAEDVRSLLG